MRIEGQLEATRKSRRLRHAQSVALGVRLQRVGAQETALQPRHVRAELVLAPAEAPIELVKTLLPFFQGFRTNERLGFELRLALLELRFTEIEVCRAAPEILLQDVELLVASLEPLGRHKCLRGLRGLDF